MNISEHTQNFIQEMRRRGKSENTIKNYAGCVKLFFERSDKDHPKNINEQDIKNFLAQFTEPNTQRNYHSAIKLFYEICLKQKDKFKYIPYCKKSEKLPIVLSVEEIQCMFNAFINYVKPIRVFVLDRYNDDKTEQIKNLKNNSNTNLREFGDDVIILAQIENYKVGINMYMLFWFDCDVSDCKIGRFETDDHHVLVEQSLVNYLDEMKKENEGHPFFEFKDNGVLNYHEVPLTWLSGWLSF